MNSQEQDACRKLLHRYKQRPTRKLRDQLFFLLKPSLEKWVGSILRRWRQRPSKEEILSYSWFGFEYAVERYRNDHVPIPFHFHRYLTYFLYQEIVRNQSETLPLFDLISEKTVNYEFREIYLKLTPSLREVFSDICLEKRPTKTTNCYYRHRRLIKEMLRSLYR